MAYTDAYLTSYGDVYGSVSRTDIYTPDYRPTYGVQFPSAPLDVKLDLNLSGWTGVTSYAQQRGQQNPITITRGRPDELSSATPSSLAAVFNNRDGRWSPRNPLGAWYGQLGRNTPLRCSVPALEPYLRLEQDAISGAFCPDAPTLDITGAIDIRIDAALSSYQPCVLASKWATTTGPIPGALVGAIINAADYTTTAGTQVAAAQVLDGYVGRPLGTACQKVYFNDAHNNPTFPTSFTKNQQGLINAKTLLWLCYKPAPDGSDWAAMSASITALCAAAAAAGAPVPKIVLWQEPQNSSNSPPLTSASVFRNMYKIYYPLIKALPASPAVIYESASHGGEASVQAWYPGDGFCDEAAQDLYATTWNNGKITLGTLRSIATSANPPKPISLGEFGTSLGQKQPAQSLVTAFFAYITEFFTELLAAGYPVAEVMWFDGAIGGPGVNTITGPADFRAGLLAGLYDALTGAGQGASADERSWALVLNGDGTVSFWWTTDGTLATLQMVTSTQRIPLGRTVIRCRIRTSGGTTVTFYTGPAGNASGPDSGTPWTQTGTVASLGGPPGIFSGGAPLTVGYNPTVTADNAGYGGPTGQIYQFQLRSFAGTYSDIYSDVYGVALGGNVVADAGFASQRPGTTAFTDSAGNGWQVTGTGEISQRSYRFHGELSSLPSTWDTTGRDVYAPAAAGGLLRRLSQGSQPPVGSAFSGAVLGLTGALAPVAYWPMEDTTGAGQFGPAIGPAAMTFSGIPQIAADSNFACSLPIPVPGTAVLRGPVAPYTGGTAVVCRFLMDVPAGAPVADDTVICRVNTTGSVGDFTLRYKTGGQLRLTGFGGGDFLFDTGALAAFSVAGAMQLVSMELTVSAGGNLKYAIRTLNVGSQSPVIVTGTVSGTPGNATMVHIGNGGSLAGTGIGHVFIQSAFESLTDFAAALAAYKGETAASRFARLCAQNGIASRVYGFPATDVPMGAQSPDTLVNLLQLCETTGRGQIYEPRQALALGYRTVGSLCQQAPAVIADYSQAHIGEDASTQLAPTLDDQHTVNDVTASDSGGGSFRATLDDGSPMSISQPPQGVGDYGNSYTVAAADDSQLPDIAGWILNIGTNGEERYPSIPFNLTRPAVAPLFYDLQEAGIGDYLQIVNTPSFLPPGPVKQLIYGTTEYLGGFRWSMAFTCVPETPYETGIFGDPVYGRIGTDGSVLDADTDTQGVADAYTDTYEDQYALASVLAVDTTGPSGILWTTQPAAFPFDIVVGGEQMTVLAVSGTVSPQSFLVTRAVNGISKAHSAGEPVQLAHLAVVGLA